MSTLEWIITAGMLMAVIAMAGSITLLMTQTALQRLLLPLVALAAGSLIGGAFFHMIPAALEAQHDVLDVTMAVAAGFTAFLLLEQLLHWHHCHSADSDHKQPFSYLILVGDGLHIFLGGLAIGGTFLIDVRLGVTSWLAAAAHELPQKLGNFAALVHGGWSPAAALILNVLSSLTFLLGGLLAYWLSGRIDVSWLVPFAAGIFLYIGASDLVPEVNRHHELKANLLHFAAFASGLGLLLLVKVTVD